MIVMGLCKDPRPEWGYPMALAASRSGNEGFKVGEYVYYSNKDNDYKCEILEIKENKVELVGLGWVDKKDCKIKLS